MQSGNEVNLGGYCHRRSRINKSCTLLLLFFVHRTRAQIQELGLCHSPDINLVASIEIRHNYFQHRTYQNTFYLQTMTLIDEIQNYFGTKNLYDVIGVEKDASAEAVTKAYRRTSLKIHPDRKSEAEKEEATKRFQVLAQVHYVLSDTERRKLYDDHGIIANEDGLQSEADWAEYWRLLFPKITENDINNFLVTYEGSKEEEQDLIRIYNKYKGDMNLICQTHISYDEDTTTAQLMKLIKQKKIPDYDKFSKEPQSKKDKRAKRFQREAKEANKIRESKKKDKADDGDLSSLTAMIQSRSKNSFDSMIASLEAKYSNGGGKGTKRKRKD